MTSPLGPYRLVTVNNAPERAKRLIGRVVEDVKDKYTIIHVTNVDDPKDLVPVLESTKPDIMFCASMWSVEQSSEMQALAKEIVPGIKTHAIPQGLQVEKGPDGVVEYLKEQLPLILAS